MKGGTQSSVFTHRTIIKEHESGHEKIFRPRPYVHHRTETCSCRAVAVVREYKMERHIQMGKHNMILASLAETSDSVPQPLPSVIAASDLLPVQPPPIPISLPLVSLHAHAHVHVPGLFATVPSIYLTDYASSFMIPQPSPTAHHYNGHACSYTISGSTRLLRRRCVYRNSLPSVCPGAASVDIMRVVEFAVVAMNLFYLL